MKFKSYLTEDRIDEMAVQTDKDNTEHGHDSVVDANGDGKTTSTKGEEDHEHIIHQWIIQSSHGHIHNLKEL